MFNSKPDGFHFLIEFFGCDIEQINDVNFWKQVLHASIEGTTMESLHDFFFEFEPQGITGYLLLSSSHISIHTWPENNYVVCDVFTCAIEAETERAVQYLKEHITYECVEIKKIQRGYRVARKGGAIVERQGCSFEKYRMALPVFSTGELMYVDVVQDIVEVETALQKIMIVDTKEFGKCLIIDNMMQAAEKDHYLYDREMIKKLRPEDKNILILGGGDGYITGRVLAENPQSKVRVDVVDLDVEVVRACERHLGQDVFCNEQAQLHIADALHYLKTTDKNYDGIIFDLTDKPIGREDGEEFSAFYDEACDLAYEKLTDGGWIAIQAGASTVSVETVDAVSIVKEILQEKSWKDIEQSDVFVPSFGTNHAFLFAKK
ncbi:MAG: adenosylmethionine decarboxylase [Parcubacteria group bacterium]|jgi:spermidine synthase